MSDPTDSFTSRLRGRWLLPTVIAVVLVFGLYYPLGMLVVHKIDDNPDYQIAADSLPQGRSRAVAMAAALNVSLRVHGQDGGPGDWEFDSRW